MAHNLKIGDRILINSYDKPVKILSLPKDMSNPKGVVRFEVQNRHWTKVQAQLGHIINGQVKYIDKPL